jgi:hypothetical protein
MLLRVVFSHFSGDIANAAGRAHLPAYRGDLKTSLICFLPTQMAFPVSFTCFVYSKLLRYELVFKKA